MSLGVDVIELLVLLLAMLSFVMELSNMVLVLIRSN